MADTIHFEQFFQNNLNKQQQQAVQHKDGAILVAACAGSGKTRVITARIAYLMLYHKIPASSIIALTFTNKAAQEMRQRITSFLPPTTAIPFVGTFHAYCLRILKQYSGLLDLPFMTILDADDAAMIIDGIIKRNGLQKTLSAKNLQHQISLYKNQLATPNMHADTSRHDQLFMQLYAAYEQEKKSSKCLDFDDLLTHTLKLFKHNAPFKQMFHQKVRHILVDEYQDTNVVQHELLKCMTFDTTNFVVDSLCAVGDEDQSIYSWRGATVSNIINFTRDFPHTTVITIEQNYRSNQHILDTAHELITHNTQRTPKKLWSTKKDTDRVRHLICNSEYQEADSIAAFFSWILRHKPKASCAIVYRTHVQSRALEEALIKNSLAYTIIGGIQFYERKEIKDVLAYLRLAHNHFDRISFLRALNCPPRGLGDKCVEHFQELWEQNPHESCIGLVKKSIEDKALSPVRIEALKQFVAIFDALSSSEHLSILSAIEYIVQATHYRSYLQKQYEAQEAKERIENIHELLRAVEHMQESGITTLDAFLEEVTLMQEKQHAASHERQLIYLMTLHAAKGLEFDYVAIAGLQEGILPSTRSLGDTNALEEERRLLYVGITRAQEYLLLSHCNNRYTYGSLSPQTKSRFLEEIPHRFLNSTRCTHMNNFEIKQYLHAWLGHSKPVALSPVTTFSRTANHDLPACPQKSWKKNQLVHHATFGVGTVITVEERAHNEPYITVQFKKGTKKIAAQFLQKLSKTI